MEKQRNIPQLRFPEYEGEWEEKKLGDVAEIKTGDKDTQNRVDDGIYPFFVRSDNVERINSYSFDGEAILTSGDGVGVGKNFHYMNGKFDFHQRVYSIRKFSEYVSGKFIFYFFSDRFYKRVIRLSAKNSVDSVRMDMITDMPIYFPTLIEQQKIASFFTAIDQKITQLKRKKNLLEHYKKGVIQKIFSQEIRFRGDNGQEFPRWEKKLLRKIAKIYDGTHQTPNYVITGIPFYSVEQVTANDFQNTKYISEDVFKKENQRVKLGKGDILMTRIGDIGTAKYIDWDVNASFYVSLALIKHSDLFNSNYLSHYISTQNFQKELWKRTIHVAFPKKINLGEIGECEVELPPLPEQTKIANFLSVIDDKINHTQTQIEKAEVWKKGLMQRMFV
ncbi:MAG: restriction endonuclease subunit S [Bacteroidales bacterium]|jgi:type I restriction enzyme S subunit